MTINVYVGRLPGDFGPARALKNFSGVESIPLEIINMMTIVVYMIQCRKAARRFLAKPYCNTDAVLSAIKLSRDQSLHYVIHYMHCLSLSKQLLTCFVIVCSRHLSNESSVATKSLRQFQCWQQQKEAMMMIW